MYLWLFNVYMDEIKNKIKIGMKRERGREGERGREESV